MSKGGELRRRAIEALVDIDTSDKGSQAAVRRALATPSPLPANDARLLTELIYGAVRCQRALDAWIGPACRKGLASVQPRPLAALRVGCYQLALLDKIPDYAAIDATTAGTGKLLSRQQRGFVHGVLRQLARSQPWAQAPTPAVLPAWIKRRARAWAVAVGVDPDAMAAAFADAAPLHVHARDDAAVEALRQEGVALQPLAGLPRVFTATDGALFRGDSFKRRQALAQDAGSVAVGRLLDAQPGDRVADVCAGRGGKSWLLTATGAEVTALDRSGDKLADARRLCARGGAPLAATLRADLAADDAADEALRELTRSFDKVLVDAPCTGLGTVRRRPEIRHRRRAADVMANALLQRAILRNAATLVAAGGTLVYAVCSMAEEEGAATVDRFLAENPAFSRVPSDVEGLPLDARGDLRAHPLWHGADAFYAARLQRI